jgi:hypothetical protein
MARLGGIFDVIGKNPAQNMLPDRVGKEEFWILKKNHLIIG